MSREIGDVPQRPLEAGLEDDADVVVSRAAHLAVQRERVVGARRILHVDAHEASAGGGVGDRIRQQRAAEREIDLEAEGR